MNSHTSDTISRISVTSCGDGHAESSVTLEASRRTFQDNNIRLLCSDPAVPTATTEVSPASSTGFLAIPLHCVSKSRAFARMSQRSYSDRNAVNKDVRDKEAVKEAVNALLDQSGGEEESGEENDMDIRLRASEHLKLPRVRAQPSLMQGLRSLAVPFATRSTQRIAAHPRVSNPSLPSRQSFQEPLALPFDQHAPTVSITSDSPPTSRKDSCDVATSSRETRPEPCASETAGFGEGVSATAGSVGRTTRMGVPQSRAFEMRPSALKHVITDHTFRPSAFAHHIDLTCSNQSAQQVASKSRLALLSSSLDVWQRKLRKKLRKLALRVKSLSASSRVSALGPVSTATIYKAMIRDARIVDKNEVHPDAIHVDIADNCEESNMWSLFDRNGQFVISCMDKVRLCGLLATPARFAFSVSNEYNFVTTGWLMLEGFLAVLLIMRTLWVSNVYDKVEVFGTIDNLSLHVSSIKWWLDVCPLTLFAFAVTEFDPRSSANADGEYQIPVTWMMLFIIGSIMQLLRSFLFSEIRYELNALWRLYFLGSLWYYIVSWLAPRKRAFSMSVNRYLFCTRDVFISFLGEDQGLFFYDDENTELILRILLGMIGLFWSNLVVVYFLQTRGKEQRLKQCTIRRRALMEQGMELLPNYFQRRVLNYFHFVTSIQDPLHKQTLMESLSPTLKLELSFLVYERVTSKTSFFYQLPCFLCKSLILALKDRFVCPGDYVIRKGELADETYFLLRGRLSVLASLATHGFEVAHEFTTAGYFGETALLSHFWQDVGRALPKRTSWVRAESYTQLAVMHNDNFNEAFEAYPDLKIVVAKRIIEENNWKYADEWSHSLILAGMRSAKEKLKQNTNDAPRVSESSVTDAQKPKSAISADGTSKIKQKRGVTFENSLLSSLKMFVEDERRYYDDIVALKSEVQRLLRVLQSKKKADGNQKANWRETNAMMR